MFAVACLRRETNTTFVTKYINAVRITIFIYLIGEKYNLKMTAATKPTVAIKQKNHPSQKHTR